jgi:hypothetical protein
MIREIGRLEATIWANHAASNRRIDDLRREVMGHFSVERRERRAMSNGGHKKRLWMHVVALGFAVLGSLLGLLKPATAAAIIVAVWRAVMH